MSKISYQNIGHKNAWISGYAPLNERKTEKFDRKMSILRPQKQDMMSSGVKNGNKLAVKLQFYLDNA